MSVCPDEFRELIHAPSKQAVRQLTPAQWDPRGDYADVVRAVAVAAAATSQPTVYRVERAGCRAEYFVVAVDCGAKTLVGVKVLAVES